MNELLSDLLIAVITAAVPVLTAFAITYIKRVAANVAAETDDVKAQGYITEIADAVSAAVAATSQTYVDALKQAGKFDLEAQKEAAQKALTACLASISPAAQAFIEALYGDLTEYLTTKIEAEVRRQKIALPSATSGCHRRHYRSISAERRNQVSQKPSRAGLFLCRRAFSFVLKRPLNINLVVGQDNAGYEALQDAPFLVLISEVPYFRSVGYKLGY